MNLKKKIREFCSLTRTGNGGFTLVELIVVIAILAILAGVAIPAYSGYITKAQDAKIVTELDAIQTAVQAANAAAGNITKIELNKEGTKVTVTATSLAENFATDFNLYYGGAADGTNANIIVLTKAIDLTGTSYAKGATWVATAETGLVAGWNANK